MKFEGGKELADNLAQLPQRISRRVQLQALREAAEPMRDGMSRLAPVEPGPPDLRDMMTISPARGTDREELAVAIGPSRRGFYGLFQEFGTVHHGAQPFARPAFDQGIAASLRILSAALWDGLKSHGVGLFTSVTAHGPAADLGQDWGSEGTVRRRQR